MGVDVQTIERRTTTSSMSGVSRRWLRESFVFIWIALWLYVSLGMVVVSFSAIQFQTSIVENSSQFGSPEKPVVVTVAHIALRHQRYVNNARLAEEIRKELENSVKSPDWASRVQKLSGELVSLLFEPGEKPADLIGEVATRCNGTALVAEAKEKCSEFLSLQNPEVKASDDLIEKSNRLLDLQAGIQEYENSFAYGQAEELEGHRRVAQFVFPWMPNDLVLSALPHPILVMIVTLSMGALGSVLFMLQVHLSNRETLASYASSITWHLFRPLQGMATALAIFLLIKAGQISVSANDELNAGGSELNVFVLGFVGVISGLLSDGAIERLSAAGVELFKVAVAERTEDETTPAKRGDRAKDSRASAKREAAARTQKNHRSTRRK